MPLHPLFLVGPDPGTAALRDALARADAVWTLRSALPAGPTDAAALRDRLAAGLRDREGRPATAASVGTAVAAAPGPVAPLAAAFGGARFVAVGADAAALLDGLHPARRRTVDPDALAADPRTVLRELCAWAGITYDIALLGPLERLARGTVDTAAYGSVSTPSFAGALDALGASLLISTYQTGRLVCARVQPDGALNTHFRTVDKPMGMALGPDGRLALGTRTEVWDLRDAPEAAAALEPPGSHDACFVPRNRHVTGDIAVHELAFAGDELWLVATAFSCLGTLDADHSFVPRWRPPWITELAPGDRCHLNGLAVVGDEVRYVTALGTTDTPGGWRAGKAAGGVVLEVPGGEVVAGGLSMPHSPRWHDGELWVLESGRGALARVDLARGTAEPVVELPGFTRGLALVGRTAFVGLSQIRETSTFGDLPVTRRLRERRCGVWIVDLDRAEILGFLAFEDLVQEVFDVLLLPGRRFPDVLEPGTPEVARTVVLP